MSHTAQAGAPPVVLHHQMTNGGIRECAERESGEARDAAGRRKKECVTPDLIRVMREAILFGRYPDEGVSFDHQEFDLG